MFGFGGANFRMESLIDNLFEALLSLSNEIVNAVAVLKDEESSFLVDESSCSLDVGFCLLSSQILSFASLLLRFELLSFVVSDDDDGSSFLGEDEIGPSLLLHGVT